MHDAKKEDVKKNNNLKYQCIATSSYFEKGHNCNIVNMKTSYIPVDNIFY